MTRAPQACTPHRLEVVVVCGGVFAVACLAVVLFCWCCLAVGVLGVSWVFVLSVCFVLVVACFLFLLLDLKKVQKRKGA